MERIRNNFQITLSSLYSNKFVIMIHFVNLFIFIIISIINSEWFYKNFIAIVLIFISLQIFFLLLFLSCCTRQNSINSYLRFIRTYPSRSSWYQQLDLQEIKNMIIYRFTSDNIDKEGESEDNFDKICPICYDKIDYFTIDLEDPTNRVVKLKCNHEFCLNCISKWCNKANTCPLCKEEILPDLDDSSDDEIEPLSSSSSSLSLLRYVIIQT